MTYKTEIKLRSDSTGDSWYTAYITIPTATALLTLELLKSEYCDISYTREYSTYVVIGFHWRDMNVKLKEVQSFLDDITVEIANLLGEDPQVFVVPQVDKMKYPELNTTQWGTLYYTPQPIIVGEDGYLYQVSMNLHWLHGSTVRFRGIQDGDDLLAGYIELNREYSYSVPENTWTSGTVTNVWNGIGALNQYKIEVLCDDDGISYYAYFPTAPVVPIVIGDDVIFTVETKLFINPRTVRKLYSLERALEEAYDK